MKETIKKSLVSGLVFSLTIVIVFVTYAASTLTAVSDEKLTASKWNDMVSALAVPAGAIMAFNLSSCPTGWVAADGTSNPLDLRGVFLRGIGGNSNGRDVARALGDYQVDTFASHSHGGVPAQQRDNTRAGHAVAAGYRLTEWSLGSNTSAIGGTETHPKNVAVLYCIKQ